MHISRVLILVFASTLSACDSSHEKAAADKSGTNAAVVTDDGLIIVPSLDERHDPIPDPSPKHATTEPKRYIVWWSGEMCIDGFYNFVVHPTQVFLRTEIFESGRGVDQVVWETKISTEQYRAIGSFLEGGTSAVIQPEPERQHAGYTLHRLNDLPRRAQLPPGNYDAGARRRACDDLAIRNLEDVKHELNRAFSLGTTLLSGSPSLGKWPLTIRAK